MTRTIDAVLTTEGAKFSVVKFKDGTEAVVPIDKEFLLPLEGGQEGWAGTEPRTSKGQAFDLLTYWGPDPRIAAQAPLQEKPAPRETPAKAPVRPVQRLDNRELSIMAQVALKEACETARAKGALSKDGFETDAATVGRAVRLFKGILKMIGEAQP